MKKDIVSVIIPNYNHGLFLKQRIESVINQTYQNIEVIILDDASIDNSKEIIECYKDHPKVSHVIYNEKNSGSPFSQWKKGIESASGEILWIAESDDVASTTFLEKMVPALLKSTETGLAFCSSNYIDTSSNIIGPSTWAQALDPVKWTKSFTIRGIKEIKSSLVFRNTIPNASAVIFKKQFSNIIYKPFFKRMNFTGDWIFWISILRKTEIVYFAEILNFQRDHIESTRAHKGIAKEIQRIKEYIKSINFAAHNSNTKIDWQHTNYDWFFLQLTTHVPFNWQTVIILSLQSRSTTFFKRLYKEYHLQ
jgi:glycosyltransferase involved in cell wall biosynthesis